jgi:hypothetical protein
MNEEPIDVVPSNSGGAVWLNILLGIWVLISPFVLTFGPSSAAIWNNVATGGAVIILALIHTSMPRQSGWSWVNLLLGIWLIISPFALAFHNATSLWNNVILGIVIAVVAWSNAMTRARSVV